MEKTFDPASTEAKLYKEWQEQRCFQPDTTSGRPAYSITIPPPNVTGSLHMGHALCYTIQDILGRWKRMTGHNVLIQPGVDHGGISTQNVVEKEIAKEGLTRQDMGRERFLERVDQWKEQYGARIVLQMQRLGCAFDWERERYTMDPAYSGAVIEHFISLFDQRLIYRGARVINWCPYHQTALSDIEVEHVDRASFLWHIRYPFSNGDGSITVATTRPETMLGDTAVAVNPNDPRYSDMHGRTLRLPLTDRDIPLIFDDYASMEFGTGAVKVTPAHDLNDFEAGRRNRLPQIVVIGEDGRMTAAAGYRYANLTREEARELVEADLEEQGYLVNKEPYRHSVGTCERCHTIIEPLLSEQWFVKMAGTEMVQSSIDVVEENRIAFVPDRYKRVYIEWMENIRDWCISRQLWWGHRIPIYYTPDGRYTAARSAAEAAAKLDLAAVTTPAGEGAGETSQAPSLVGAGGELLAALRQDEDVLDTWFSSDLWPFATLGWPRNTLELAAFYPTDVLVTSREILYLWVARMIMMGLEFTGNIPFKQVYIYATVLDKQGRRMSKSLGNGIDPIEMIDKYGADALRYSLVRLASKGQDIRYSEDRIPEARNFCTKIWNAARFVLMNLEDYDPAGILVGVTKPYFSLPERWILTRLQRVAGKLNAALSTYDMDDACIALYEFFWNDYCDWFLELAKPGLRVEEGADEAQLEARRCTQWVLSHVLDSALRLMHPFMPFISEEIWQQLPGRRPGETIMRADYPTTDETLIDEFAAAQMDTIIDAIRAVRTVRAELQIPPSKLLDVIIVADPERKNIVERNWLALQSLAKLGAIVWAAAPPTSEGIVALPVQDGLDLYLSLTGLVNMEKERARVEVDLAAVESDYAKVSGKLANPMFIEKGAPDIVARDRALLIELTNKKAKLEARRVALSG